MYPIVRMAKQLWLNRNAPPLDIGQDHIAMLRAWPWDIDVFLDLNNGRVLTLFDLGRLGLFKRMGILDSLKHKGWYGTVAGTVIRYRKRITAFQRLELRTRIAGWDDRFVYFEQAFWSGNDCMAHGVVRTAITSGKGIVPTCDVLQAIGIDAPSPEMPPWIRLWVEAENARPWPPEQR